METTQTQQERMARAAKRPILCGWALWLRTLPGNLVAVLPIAIIASALVVGWFPGVEIEFPGSFWLRVAALAGLFIYGFALVSLQLSDAHLGRERRGPFSVPLDRLASWVGTWLIVTAATAAGLALLIVPGLVVWMRLAWADEYALAHSLGPVEACRASWRLSEGKTLDIFGFQFLLSLAENVPWLLGLLVFALAFRGLSELNLSGEVFNFVLGSIGVGWLLVLYGSFHAPEVVYFYGMQGRRS